MWARSAKWDCVIVGGGIVGLTVAHYLHERAAKYRLLVIEQERIGAGASRYSIGLHLPYGRTAERKRLAAISAEEFVRLQEWLPRSSWRALEFFGLCRSSSLPAHLHRFSSRSEVIAARERARLPLVNTGEEEEWIRVEGCHQGNVPRVCEALCARLRASSRVALWEGVRVIGVEAGDRESRLRISCGSTVRADAVVIAPGPWSRSTAFQELAAGLPIRIKKVAAIHVEQAPRRDDPVMFFLEDDAFLIPAVGERRWLFSFRSPQWDVDPREAFASGIGRSEVSQGSEVLAKHAPSVLNKLAGGRVFCDCYSMDGAPIIRQLGAASRVVFAGAGGGSGYRLAPAIAVTTVEALL